MLRSRIRMIVREATHLGMFEEFLLYTDLAREWAMHSWAKSLREGMHRYGKSPKPNQIEYKSAMLDF